MPSAQDPERARLLRRLTQQGLSLEAATEAVDADRVMLTLLQHLVGGPRDFTRAQAAARAGLDQEVAAAIERAAGLGNDPRYSEGDIRQLSLISQLLKVLPTEVVMDQARADIPALRTLALRTMDTVDGLLMRDVVASGADAVDAATSLATVIKPLLDLTVDLIGQSYRRVVLGLLTSDLVAEALRNTDETLEVAVGFVDVVGYTSLTGRIDPQGLGDVLRAFESACQQLVEVHPGLTLVKFLGDAAMFVALDPVGLARALMDLVGVEATLSDEAIPVSAGLAFGSALLRGGDYFGQPVNEAARLTDLARQHTLLASDQLKEKLEDIFSLRRLAPVNLHGIGTRRPYAVRPLSG